MARITHFEVSEKKSIASQYEPRYLMFNVVIDEGENESEVVAQYIHKLKWQINLPERVVEYAKWLEVVKVGGVGKDEAEVAKSLAYAQKFVSRFEEAKAEIEGV